MGDALRVRANFYFLKLLSVVVCFGFVLGGWPTEAATTVACSFFRAKSHGDQSVGEGLVYKSMEFVDNDHYWSTLDPYDQLFQIYKDWVVSHADPEPVRLLERQREIARQHAGDKRAARYDLILDGRVGAVMPTSCLEKLLLRMHFSHQNPTRAPSEFGAAIFRKTEKDRVLLRVLFLSNAEPSISWSSIEWQIREEQSKGWQYWVNLHNHPFWFQGHTGDTRGTIVPSGNLHAGDIAVFHRHFNHYSLQEAWITNGFSTIKILPRDMALLSRLP